MDGCCGRKNDRRNGCCHRKKCSRRASDESSQAECESSREGQPLPPEHQVSMQGGQVLPLGKRGHRHRTQKAIFRDGEGVWAHDRLVGLQEY